MRLVVVGGVATGMGAAARARRLDEHAEIVVLERGDHVSFANCGLPYYVGGEIENESDLLVQTPESLGASLDLDVRVRHEVVGLDATAKTVRVRNEQGVFDLEYDALVLAPGAAAIRPAIPGLDSPRVSTLRTVGDALRLRTEVTRIQVDERPAKAVVLGAGFIGLEAAEALQLAGAKTTVVELAPHVLPPLEPELAVLVRKELESLEIAVLEGVGASKITHGTGTDTVTLSNGEHLEADLIVLSTGVRPDTRIFETAGLECKGGAIIVDEYGRTNLDSVWAGGDATLSRDAVTLAQRPVPLAGPANRAGRQIADDITNRGQGRPLPNPIGTAIVRVGELTAALTGANRRSLSNAGISHHTINLHPNQHAGYFPGAQQMHLIVHFAKDDGRVLGAQGVGVDGVDKRIDVLATAIRAKMSISDLIDLDLSYSPPYGSAKDPVNLAGMLGENVLNRTTVHWHAEELEQVLRTSLIIDARTPAEYQSGHIPGAVNIPNTEIRDRVEEVKQLANGRPIRLHCQSGFRSYLAERILRQSGFKDVANLSGGMLTLKEAIDAGVTPDIELIREDGS